MVLSRLVGQKRTRTIPQLAFVILMNEIVPRINKYGLKLDDIPPEFTQMLLHLEHEGKIDRKRLREFLDDHCEWVKAGRPRDPEEDKALLEYITNKELL